MSIPPKYGRVYTRINGGVSCEAITFPFLRFSCTHGRNRARVRHLSGGYDTKDTGGEQWNTDGGDRNDIARTYEAVPAIPCDRTIPASIYNGRLLIARWLIALRSSCRELIPGRDILTA